MKKIIVFLNVIICVVFMFSINVSANDVSNEINENLISVDFNEKEVEFVKDYCIYNDHEVMIDYDALQKQNIDCESEMIKHIESMYEVFNSVLKYDEVSLDNDGNLVYALDDDYETQWAANYLGGNIWKGWTWKYDSDVMYLFATIGLFKSIFGTGWNINSIVKSKDIYEGVANLLTTALIGIPMDLGTSVCATFVDTNFNYLVGIVGGLITMCAGGLSLANIIVSAITTILGFYLPNIIQVGQMYNAASNGRSLQVVYKLWGVSYNII